MKAHAKLFFALKLHDVRYRIMQNARTLVMQD